jgi:hypothetical protein
MGCSTDSLWTVTNNRVIRVATKRKLVCLRTSLLFLQVSSLAILKQRGDGNGEEQRWTTVLRARAVG